jgi:CubicO group peptidase (beta-lactamase class C family)
MSLNRRTWLQTLAMGGAALAVAGQAAAEGQAAAVGVTPRSNGSGKYDYAPAVEALRRYIDLHMKTYALPGMTIGMADGDGYSTTLTAGYADISRKIPVADDNLFQIGSITKQLVDICLFRAAAAGKLDLDASVNAVLPGVNLPSDQIKVRDLINHRSGIPGDSPVFTRANGGKLWQGFPLGDHFSYCNTGYEILGLILERVEKKPLRDVIQGGVLGPLGMTRASGTIRLAERARYALGYQTFQPDRAYVRGGRLAEAPWIDTTSGAGCVAATAGDMNRYATWLVNAGAGRGGGLMSDSAAREFTTAVIDAPDFGPTARYGNGVATIPVDGKPCLHHTGGMVAFSSALTVDPAAGVGCFASVNAGSLGHYRPREVTAYAIMLMRAVRAGQPLPAAPAIEDPRKIENAAKYAGTLKSASGETLTVRAEGDRLFLVTAEGSAVLEGEGGGSFAVDHPRYGLYILDIEPSDGGAKTAWWGPTVFAADAGRLASLAPSAALLPYAGRYSCDDAWRGPAMRFNVRGDKLWGEGMGPIDHLPDGVWRPAGGESPERLWFDSMIDGQPHRLNFGGADYTRASDIG